MSDIFAIRNLNKETKEIIIKYAHSNNLTMAEALSRLVFLGLQHMKNSKKKKKYENLLETYDELKFKDSKYSSQDIDKILYGKRS